MLRPSFSIKPGSEVPWGVINNFFPLSLSYFVCPPSLPHKYHILDLEENVTSDMLNKRQS